MLAGLFNKVKRGNLGHFQSASCSPTMSKFVQQFKVSTCRQRLILGGSRSQLFCFESVHQNLKLTRKSGCMCVG